MSNLYRALRDGSEEVASSIVRQSPGYYLGIAPAELDLLPPLSGILEPLAGRMTVAARYMAVGDVQQA